jgi:hypothetical protein
MVPPAIHLAAIVSTFQVEADRLDYEAGRVVARQARLVGEGVTLEASSMAWVDDTACGARWTLTELRLTRADTELDAQRVDLCGGHVEASNAVLRRPTLWTGARRLKWTGTGEVDATDVVVSGCPCAARPWSVTASRLRGSLDGLARADWPVLYVGAIPVATAPVWWVPLGPRVPGLLLPRGGWRVSSGVWGELPAFLPLGESADAVVAPGWSDTQGVTGALTLRLAHANRPEGRLERLGLSGNAGGGHISADAALGGPGARVSARGETGLGDPLDGVAGEPVATRSRSNLEGELAVSSSHEGARLALASARLSGLSGREMSAASEAAHEVSFDWTTLQGGWRAGVSAEGLDATALGAQRVALALRLGGESALGPMRWAPSLELGAQRAEGVSHDGASGGRAQLVASVAAVGGPVEARHRVELFAGGAAMRTQGRPDAWTALVPTASSNAHLFAGLGNRWRLGETRAEADLWWSSFDGHAPGALPGGRLALESGAVVLTSALDADGAVTRLGLPLGFLETGLSHLWLSGDDAGAGRRDPRRSGGVDLSDVAPSSLQGSALDVAVIRERWRLGYVAVADTARESARVEAQRLEGRWAPECDCLQLEVELEHARGRDAPEVRLGLTGRY